MQTKALTLLQNQLCGTSEVAPPSPRSGRFAPDFSPSY
jgi:hypothetical protein